MSWCASSVPPALTCRLSRRPGAAAGHADRPGECRELHGQHPGHGAGLGEEHHGEDAAVL